MKAKNAKDARTVLEHEAIPLDANGAGFVHGGAIMRMIDNAAGMVAKKHCMPEVYNVVTVRIDNIEFINPAHIGDLLIAKAQMNYTGGSSMEVEVEVKVKCWRTGEVKPISRVLATFVGTDKDGKPTEIPQMTPRSADERKRFAEGKTRMEERRKLREAKKKAQKKLHEK